MGLKVWNWFLASLLQSNYKLMMLARHPPRAGRSQIVEMHVKGNFKGNVKGKVKVNVEGNVKANIKMLSSFLPGWSL